MARHELDIPSYRLKGIKWAGIWVFASSLLRNCARNGTAPGSFGVQCNRL